MKCLGSKMCTSLILLGNVKLLHLFYSLIFPMQSNHLIQKNRNKKIGRLEKYEEFSVLESKENIGEQSIYLATDHVRFVKIH